MTDDPRIAALPDIHGHAKGEHKPFAEERPIPYTARMLFLWFYHACRRGAPRFVMVADHMNYLTFEDPAAVNLVRRALKLAQAGDLYGAAETAGVEIGHAAAVSDGLRKGMRYSIGAEIDNDPRCRPDAQNIVDAMRPDGMIRSIHFLPIAHPQHGENWMWAFDNPEFKDLYEVVGTERVWEIYMATLLEAIGKLPGHIVGHFYVPAKFGHWPDDAALESYEDRLLDACAEHGLAVEVNSRYFYKHYAGDDEAIARYRSVHLRLLRKASEKGVMIAVGSDAHSPKDQGAGFDAVLSLLDEANINEIAFPIAGRLARVALRATDEIRRQHAAALSAARASQPVAAQHDGEEPDEEPAPVAATAEATEITAPARPAAARPSKPRPAPAAAPPDDGTLVPPSPAGAGSANESAGAGHDERDRDARPPVLAGSATTPRARPPRKRPSRATVRAAAGTEQPDQHVTAGAPMPGAEPEYSARAVVSPDVAAPAVATAAVAAEHTVGSDGPGVGPAHSVPAKKPRIKAKPAAPARAALAGHPAAAPHPARSTAAKKAAPAGSRSKAAGSAKATPKRAPAKAPGGKKAAPARKATPPRTSAKKVAARKPAARKTKATVKRTSAVKAATKRAAAKPAAKKAAKKKAKSRR